MSGTKYTKLGELADQIREYITDHPETEDYEVWIESDPSSPLLGTWWCDTDGKRIFLG